MPIEAPRWVFGEGWGASSWSSAIPEDGEALLHVWRRRRDDDENVYDLETLLVENEEESPDGMNHGQDAEQHRSSSSAHAPDRGDFASFHGETSFWTTPAPFVPSSPLSRSLETPATPSAPMLFDPFAQQEESIGPRDDGMEVLDKADVFSIPDFMPDPVVDPSGITVDRFMVLDGVEANKDVEFYPNRAVKLYYQGVTSLDGTPECFVCPISLEIMSDPVILPDGHSFDRIALAKWLEINNTSPATRQVVSLDDIRPNWMLKNLIRQYRRNVKERRKQQRLNSLAEVLERRRQRKMPVSFDGRSRIAI
jgi:U-box domain